VRLAGLQRPVDSKPLRDPSSRAAAEQGPPALPDALIRHTGFLPSRMGMVATTQFSERLAGLGLSTRTWGALNVLDAEGAIAQHALGKRVGADPSSVVSTIDELEAKGLVQRRPHPSDAAPTRSTSHRAANGCSHAPASSRVKPSRTCSHRSAKRSEASFTTSCCASLWPREK